MHPSQTNAARQRRRVLSRAENTDAFGFFNLLTGPQLLDDVEELLPDHRERLFPPTETLAMFMAQALSADGSCRQAVNDAAVKRLVAGMAPLSSNTAAYCQARSRLPQTLVSTLAQRTGALLTEGAADWWHWRGKRVCLADGTTATMADTQENQAKYPQPGSQREGLGFPMMRVVALVCLASGALLDAATGACKFGLLAQIQVREPRVAQGHDDVAWSPARSPTANGGAGGRGHLGPRGPGRRPGHLGPGHRGGSGRRRYCRGRARWR
jgi:hypothetical protein